MPHGMSGVDLADNLHALKPDLKLVYMSGGNPESRTPDIGGLKMSAFFSGRLPDRVAQPELRSWKQRWDRLKFLA
jgi:hypothetical protein